MKVLIVEDDEQSLYMLESLLKGHGYSVVSAKNGKEALEKLDVEKFDLIISDILMPVMDGFQLCKECKQDKKLKDIPFIFYTATYTEEKDEELALRYGANKYVHKPHEPIEFIAIIKEVIKDAKEGKIKAKKLAIAEEREVFKLYSERLVNKLEKKMLELEREIQKRQQLAEEKEKIQAQLFQAQKMEALGRLSAGVAHDFRNLLTVISGYCDLILNIIGTPENIKEPIIEIERAAAQATALTDQLLTFSRKQAIQQEKVNLNKLVSEIKKMLGRIIRKNVTLKTVLNASVSYVKADKGQIKQVIMNLVVNARDAMPEGGKIVLKTENVSLNKDSIELIPGSRSGNFICLSIEDAGVGMNRETIERIFEPFFSTKARGKGTGLGLSVVFGIIKQHEGWINVQSKPDHGTTFKIYLPAVVKKQK